MLTTRRQLVSGMLQSQKNHNMLIIILAAMMGSQRRADCEQYSKNLKQELSFE